MEGGYVDTASDERAETTCLSLNSLRAVWHGEQRLSLVGLGPAKQGVLMTVVNEVNAVKPCKEVPVRFFDN